MPTARPGRRSATLAVSAALAVALLAGGCSSSGPAAEDAADAKITLTVNLFSEFGYADLYKQYEQLHPNITVKENRADLGTHHQNLRAHLLAGSGTADIEAVEIGQVAGFQPQASKFVDFLQYGVSKDQWVPSKTAPASSADGKALFGLGTDQALWSQPDIAGFTDPLFNGAPTGKIFSQSAKDLQPQPLGAHGAEIGTAIGNALTSIEQGKADPATAWQKALADVANITG
ncbi:hypothetical protein AB0442_23770 [Kitasatospora sp. NPDC085895]|uniref:hypothetical protein n=1 Tax=Kitasatospora sp. NPDC085895 TaxID=3155057 RepID=UPI00344DA90D